MMIECQNCGRRVRRRVPRKYCSVSCRNRGLIANRRQRMQEGPPLIKRLQILVQAGGSWP